MKRKDPDILKLALILLIASGCKGTRPDTPLNLAAKKAYFFWQVDAQLPAPGELHSAGGELLYVRLFDLSSSGGEIRPVAVRGAVQAKYPIIPVVYLTLPALENLRDHDLLAQRTLRLVRQLVPIDQITELQLDADWTRSTRKRYFRFLRALRAEITKAGLSWRLSATIRLHQLRDQSMGLPPVDRGMLMIYNTGRLTDFSEENSILKRETTLPYLKYASRYPVPLDLALPDFAWAVAFVHGSFHALVSGVEENNQRSHLLPVGPNRYLLKESIGFGGILLPERTHLRFERADPGTRIQVLHDIKDLPPLADRRLAIFDYQKDRTLKNREELERLFRIAGNGL